MLWVYLDQCKWIDLAKADAGKPDGAKYLSVLTSAREAVRNQKVCFPLSFPHLHETARSPRLEQRQLLARLMTELSQGVVLRSPLRLIKDALKNAVRKLFGLPYGVEVMSPFGRGFEDVIDFDLAKLSPHLSHFQLASLRQFIDSPSVWIDILSQNIEPVRVQTIAAIATTATRGADAHQEDRELLADSSEDEVRRVFYGRVTLHFYKALKAALEEIDRTIEDWGSSGPAKLLEFWDEIPYVHAQMELEIAMHHDKSRRWSKNDMADLNFLGVAIPACDVVVADKAWIHTAKKVRLNGKFNTELLVDLVDLGCRLNL